MSATARVWRVADVTRGLLASDDDVQARTELQLDGGLMAKVTGIGGVFFKSTNDHKRLGGARTWDFRSSPGAVRSSNGPMTSARMAAKPYGMSSRRTRGSSAPAPPAS